MHTTISSAGQFRDAFHSMGRAKQFSYDALGLLFDYLDEVDPDMELDVVAICCDYAEDTAASIAESYGLEVENDETDGEMLDAVMDYLNDNTSVIGKTAAGTIVYAQF